MTLFYYQLQAVAAEVNRIHDITTVTPQQIQLVLDGDPRFYNPTHPVCQSIISTCKALQTTEPTSPSAS